VDGHSALHYVASRDPDGSCLELLAGELADRRLLEGGINMKGGRGETPVMVAFR
jgi:hypothetical protein